jgi:hypothetical protein
MGLGEFLKRGFVGFGWLHFGIVVSWCLNKDM